MLSYSSIYFLLLVRGILFRLHYLFFTVTYIWKTKRAIFNSRSKINIITLHETLKLGEIKTLLAISSEIKLTNTDCHTNSNILIILRCLWFHQVAVFPIIFLQAMKEARANFISWEGSRTGADWKWTQSIMVQGFVCAHYFVLVKSRDTGSECWWFQV